MVLRVNSAKLLRIIYRRIAALRELQQWLVPELTHPRSHENPNFAPLLIQSRSSFWKNRPGGPRRSSPEDGSGAGPAPPARRAGRVPPFFDGHTSGGRFRGIAPKTNPVAESLEIWGSRSEILAMFM